MAIVEIVSTVLVFVFKDILHAIVALSDAFLLNAALFLLLKQPILAILQLFIMIGGIATYLFVGVGSEGLSKFKHVNTIQFYAVLIGIFVVISFPLIKVSFAQAQQSNILSPSNYPELFSQIGILYLITVMLFGVGIASIVLLKRLENKK